VKEDGMLERISHIGVLVHDLDAAARAWSEQFGLKRYLDYVAECEGIKACLLSPGGTREEMSIELIEPLDKTDLGNPLARRLAEQGEGFFHLAVIARDVADSSARLPVTATACWSKGSEALLFPDSSHGLIPQLALPSSCSTVTTRWRHRP